MESENGKERNSQHIDNKDIRSEGRSYKIICPNCSSQRKNKKDTPLSVNISIDMITYYCHHCNIKGGISRKGERSMEIVSDSTTSATLTTSGSLSIMSSKGGSISIGTIKEEKLSERRRLENGWAIERLIWIQKKWIVSGGDKTFTGNRFSTGKTKVSACEWRTANGKKDFWWTNSASRLWERKEESKRIEGLVITEGEMDALSIKQAFLDIWMSLFSLCRMEVLTRLLMVR